MRIMLQRPIYWLGIFACAVSAGGCASVKIPMNPQVSNVSVARKLPVKAALLITPEVKQSTICKRPSFLIGWAYRNEYPMGEALETASLQVFSQLFEGLSIVRDPAEAKANYRVVLEPSVEGFSYYHSLRWLWWITHSRAKVKVTVFSGQTKVWELEIKSGWKGAEPKTWFKRFVWESDFKQRVGESASKALTSCLEEIATRMAQDQQLAEIIQSSGAFRGQGAAIDR